MSSNPITVPSGYATAFAIGFADAASGNLSIVDSGRPLPVSPIRAAASAPLTGSTAASGTFGPFTPIPERPVFISLSGTWQGTVSLRRSLDGGQTLLPLTLGGQAWASFSANACEPLWEEHEDGATLFLAVTLTSGTVSYRLSQ